MEIPYHSADAVCPVVEQSSQSQHIHRTLSKQLFNLDHYYMIPLLFLMSFFVCFDRGGLSASLNNAQDQLLDGSASKSGTVASCYIFGWCLSAPIFALLGGKYPPLKMSAIGMAAWCLGAW